MCTFSCASGTARGVIIAVILSTANLTISNTAAIAKSKNHVRLAYSVETATVSRKPLIEQGNGPFGLFEIRAPDSLLWAKWRRVEEVMHAEAKIIAQCRAEPNHCASPAAVRFLSIVTIARALEGRRRLQAVNREVNGSIRYMSDLAQHGVLDLWSAPLETFASGRGDCEDYAIAKFAILQEAGMADEDLRLVLVRDHISHQDHAVLAVRDAGRWLFLDNRHSVMLDAAELPNFMPLFAIDHQGVKLFAASYAMPPAHENKGDIAPTAAFGKETARTYSDLDATP